MRMPRLRTLLLTPVVLIALMYVAGAVMLAMSDNTAAPLDGPVSAYETIAIFGASGTAGDGILKAALANPEIDAIHVITRRATPRIEQGVAAGKVQMTIHLDYLDYAAIQEQMSDVDAVYWAIGTSSLGVDEETYGRIHVDFPARFMASWLRSSTRRDATFHYISSSDISDESTAMWAREKVRAERMLFELAEDTNIRVIAYRPDYIGPTDEEAHLGQDLLYWFFAPIGAAVKAEAIGQAMFEITARGEQFTNGDKIGTRKIVRYSNAFVQRRMTAK